MAKTAIPKTKMLYRSKSKSVKRAALKKVSNMKERKAKARDVGRWRTIIFSENEAAPKYQRTALVDERSGEVYLSFDILTEKLKFYSMVTDTETIYGEDGNMYTGIDGVIENLMSFKDDDSKDLAEAIKALKVRILKFIGK